MATIGGNFVNASPIGDLSIMFLVLDAELIIDNKGKKRNILLKNFFKEYKEIDLAEGEIIESLSFPIPPKGFKYHFEKVSKRTHLDIASVNTAVYLVVDDKKIITDINISAGGVAAVPFLLKQTSAFLKGKELTNDNIQKATDILLSEISPISDIRGSSEYKKLLLKQLFLQHFASLFSELFSF
jgi:xanthine dehydrogenase small subunit